MPGSSGSMAPFFARLPSLRSDQKVAAVNLGIFPDSAQPSLAYVPRPSAGPSPALQQTVTAQSGYAAPPPVASGRPVQMASISPHLRAPAVGQAAQSTARRRVWLQLASGSNPDALPDQFRRIKARHKDLLDGISGYVAHSPDRSRLLIGPFKNVADANIFAEDLESVSVDAFSWTNPPGETIRKLSTE